MVEEFLKLGVQAAKAGDHEKARAYFANVVQTDPKSEAGWLFLGDCLDDRVKKTYCYQKVLQLNPANPQAKKALTSLTQPDEPAQMSQAALPPALLPAQPAESALGDLTQPDGRRQTNRAALPPAPESASKGEAGGPKKPRSSSSRLLEGALVGLVILFAGALLVFANSTGTFDRPADKLPASTIPASTIPIHNVIPMGTLRVAPSRTPTRALRPTWTPFDTNTLIPTATLPIDAIDHWGEVISENPEDADAYYQRATIYKSAPAIGSQDVYISQLDLGLRDIDKAISLYPDIGDYYSLRQSIYFKLACCQEYQVDREYLTQMALDNAYMAYKLGTTIEDYPERIIITDLIFTNQCQKALDETQTQIALLPAGDDSLGGLLHIRSQAYACLGRLEDALASVNDSMFNNENMDYKNDLKVQYLIMLGRYDEALPLLDQLISKSALNGYRYYWRAEIYYNTGKKDLVQNELDTGMLKTWGRGGMLPYVEAQMALDEDRKNDAIQLLQYAEATFSLPEDSLRWKVQKLLASLGAKPLNLTPSAPYHATPIP